jgi:hypothetical protein
MKPGFDGRTRLIVAALLRITCRIDAPPPVVRKIVGVVLALAQPRMQIRVIQEGLGVGVDPAEIGRLAARTRDLISGEPSDTEWQLVFLDFLPAFHAWLHDDVVTTARIVDTVSGRSARHTRLGALFDLALGRIKRARAEFEREAIDGREADLALGALLNGDRNEAATHAAHARAAYGNQLALTVWLSLETGEAAETDRFVKHVWNDLPYDGHSPGPDSGWGESVRLILRPSWAHEADAMTELDNALHHEDRNRARYIRLGETVAQLAVDRHDLGRAAAVLEDTLRARGPTFNGLAGGTRGESFFGVFWIRNCAMLADVNRRMWGEPPTLLDSRAS